MRSQMQGPHVRLHRVSDRNGLAWFNRLKRRAQARGFVVLGLTVAGDYLKATFLDTRPPVPGV